MRRRSPIRPSARASGVTSPTFSRSFLSASDCSGSRSILASRAGTTSSPIPSSSAHEGPRRPRRYRILTIGQGLEIEYRVGESDLASALSLEAGDAFPAVFATSRMVALMELAASRLMKGELKSGELSVGVGVEVKHHAA